MFKGTSIFYLIFISTLNPLLSTPIPTGIIFIYLSYLGGTTNYSLPPQILDLMSSNTGI